MGQEKIVSPGVFTEEYDLSYLPKAIGEIGAVLIGPTVKGRALVPVEVSSYAEYQELFGDTFKSGSGYYQYLTSLTAEQYLKYGNKLTVIKILAGNYGPAESEVPISGSTWSQAESSSATLSSFQLITLADGSIMNSSSSYGTNNVLVSGSKDNIQWEISNVNESRGTFTLVIRRGNDTVKRKIALETWSNLTLDPNSTNYIARRIGDMTLTLRDSGTTSPFLQPSGSYANKSKYVRVNVRKKTVDYLNENGDIRIDAASASLPALSSGSFSGGSDGNINHPQLFYDNIVNTNSQGYVLNTAGSGSDSYLDAIKIMSNADEYDFNLMLIPGVIDAYSNHQAIASKAIDVCEDRGDAFVILDPVGYGSSITDATTEASTRNTSYAAHYWPWVQIPDRQLGENVWVPPSVVISGIYAFNDKIAHEWYAPAGLNRGGVEDAIQTERKLTHANRDDLYENNVNPIATFPREGVVVWGQKTLQKKASALDRVNVRRLLIKAKKFIASTSRYLVFEQNTSATRNRFLNIANPWFEQVQQKQGLYNFKVKMDEDNNTPDIIDRNILYGQIWIQPARTAEFIVIDFNVLPTGATFPD